MNASDDGNNNPWRNNNHPWENSPPDSNPPQRKGKGRQKVPMEKIENETNLQVTFSKRRAGVFKKVSEISILCGAEAAVVVFSPGDKAHSFGHPDVETVANRFLNANAPAGGGVDPLIAAHNEAVIRQRSQELIQVEAQLEQERQRKRELEEERRAYRSQNLFPPPLEEMTLDQLEQLKKAVLAFRRNFEAKLKKKVTVERSDPNPDPEPQGGMGVQWAGGSSGLGIGPSNQFPLYDYGPSNQMGFGVGPGIGPSIGPGGASSSSYVPPSGGNVMDNQGYMVQYPDMGGPGAPEYMVPYDFAQAPAFNPMQDSGSIPHYGNYGDMFPFGGGPSYDGPPYGGGPSYGGPLYGGLGGTSSSNMEVGGPSYDGPPYGGGPSYGGPSYGGPGGTSSSNVEVGGPSYDGPPYGDGPSYGGLGGTSSSNLEVGGSSYNDPPYGGGPLYGGGSSYGGDPLYGGGSSYGGGPSHNGPPYGGGPSYGGGSQYGGGPSYGGPPYGDGPGGTSSSNVEGGGNDPMETQFNFQNNFQGFNNNYYDPKDY